MTEQLNHRPLDTSDNLNIEDTAELQAHFDLELDDDIETGTTTFNREEQKEAEHKNVPNDSRELSPFARRIRNAAERAERIASQIETRTINRAHDEALKEYRKIDHTDYTDHISNLADNGATDEIRRANDTLLRKDGRDTKREERIEAGKEKLKSLGYIALSLGALGYEKAGKLGKDAGLTALGVGVMGYEAASKRADTAKFRHEMNSERRSAKKSSSQELKQFNKDAKRESKLLKKSANQDIRVAKKDDRRFEREMRAKMRSEKWEARIHKIGVVYEGKKEAVVVRVENGVRRAGETYRSTKESYESVKATTAEKKRKLGSFAVKARAAGQAAVAAGREELKK